MAVKSAGLRNFQLDMGPNFDFTYDAIRKFLVYLYYETNQKHIGPGLGKYALPPNICLNNPVYGA